MPTARGNGRTVAAPAISQGSSYASNYASRKHTFGDGRTLTVYSVTNIPVVLPTSLQIYPRINIDPN